MPWSLLRWIAQCFMAFSKMSSIFAANPPGLLPNGDATVVEQVYLQYREDYNSILENCWLFRIVLGDRIGYIHKVISGFYMYLGIPNKFIQGLAMWALEKQRLLFPVRPKMHNLEHLPLAYT